MARIERDCNYWESYLPSSRHRKPRWREVCGTVAAEIPEVTNAEAPVAIIHSHAPGMSRLFPVCRDRGNPNRVEYHWYKGRFYTAIRRSMFCCYYGDDMKKKGARPARLSDISWSYYGIVVAGLESRQKSFTEAMARYLIIDGQLCAEIGEPRYVVMTFGLGANHGGTAVMVSHSYNSNIMTEAYFRADEEAEAREAAMIVAAGRGDTNSVAQIRRRFYNRFTILIPEAVTLDRDARSDTVDPFSARMATITNSGMPSEIKAIALLAAAVTR